MQAQVKPAVQPNCPPLRFTTGASIKAYRAKHKLTQIQFWNRVDVTQSCGSRYEAGRRIPLQILYLLHFAYGTPRQAGLLQDWLRRKP
jgi:DNA-binding transcriptional regulator YiaG